MICAISVATFGRVVVRSEAATDGYVFRYRATVATYIGDGKRQDQPFDEKAVEGTIERLW